DSVARGCDIAGDSGCGPLVSPEYEESVAGDFETSGAGGTLDKPGGPDPGSDVRRNDSRRGIQSHQCHYRSLEGSRAEAGDFHFCANDCYVELRRVGEATAECSVTGECNPCGGTAGGA